MRRCQMGAVIRRERGENCKSHERPDQKEMRLACRSYFSCIIEKMNMAPLSPPLLQLGNLEFCDFLLSNNKQYIYNDELMMV